jgi:hypothetical protein
MSSPLTLLHIVPSLCPLWLNAAPALFIAPRLRSERAEIHIFIQDKKPARQDYSIRGKGSADSAMTRIFSEMV